MTKRDLVNKVLEMRKPTGRPVFITGNGRSGTSWIGETLGRANGVIYYREPCNPSSRSFDDDSVWSRVVPPNGNDVYFEECLTEAFAGFIPLKQPAHLGDLAKHVFLDRQVVIKEVATYPSLEWVCGRWNPKVLIVMRHPCDYVMSVRAADLDRTESSRLLGLLAQECLRDTLLVSHAAHLATIHGGIETSAAIWAIKNLVATDAMDRHPDWKVVKYEDVCQDPLREFQGLYKECGLEWTKKVAGWIQSKSESISPGAYKTSRVSKQQVGAWRTRASPGEVKQVRRVLEPFNLPFYQSEGDW